MYKEATGEEAAISQKDVDLFNNSIEPLVKYGKLGALLAQFPPSFKNDNYGRRILSAVIRTFGRYWLLSGLSVSASSKRRIAVSRSNSFLLG